MVSVVGKRWARRLAQAQAERALCGPETKVGYSAHGRRVHAQASAAATNLPFWKQSFA